MTKPEGIPEPLAHEARIALFDAFDEHEAEFGRVCTITGGMWDALVEATARAILAERNRAADVAESWAGTERRLAIRTEYNDEATSHMLCADLAIDIAEHIRSPRSPHNPKDAQ